MRTRKPAPASHLLPAHATVLAQVHQARQAWHQKDAKTAAPLFLRVVQSVPDLLEELEPELADALAAYAGMLLQQPGDSPKRQALWLMDNAALSLSSSKLVVYAQGRICYEARQYVAALRAFRRALELDPGFGTAREALESIQNLAVDRWHFRMLNDKARNVAFQHALRQLLAEERANGPPPRVLDIGTGTGLLAWMALEAGAGHVVACETNPVLSTVARDLLGQERATVVNASSYDLHLTGGLVDVVVTELVDAGLLGEHILPVLRHARRQLLRPGGRIIPHAATVHAVVIESEEIRRRARLLVPAAALWLGEGESRSDDIVTVDESYTCEKLASLPHKPLTRAVQVLEVPLADPLPGEGEEESLVVEVDLDVDAEGQADAVAMWFELDLLPPNSTTGERCCVSTGPQREQNAWDQGIYFLPAAHVLQRGRPCRLRVAVQKDQLSFALVVEGHSTPAPMRTPTINVGEMEMAQLNDTRRLEAYRDALAAAGDGPIGAVLEWSGKVSVLSLLVPAIPKLAALPCVVMTASEESATALRAWHAARKAAWPVAIHVAADTNAQVHTLLSLKTQLTASSSSRVLLLHDLVETSGWLRQGALRDVRLAQQVLGPSSICLLPSAFSIVLQGFESPFLLQQNRLESDSLLGYPVEAALDGLGVSKFRELDLGLTQREHQPLTGVRAGMRVDLSSLPDKEIVGKARVVLPVAAAGTLHAIGFWFDVHLTERLSLGTGPVPLSSYRQGAVLVAPREVGVGQRLGVEVVCSISRGVEIAVVSVD